MDRTTSQWRISADEKWKISTRTGKSQCLNRAIQGAACAGIGIPKSVTATAMLEDKVPPESFTYLLPGLMRHFMDANSSAGCTGKSSHGVRGPAQSHFESCDIFFYKRWNALGASTAFLITAANWASDIRPESISLGRTGADAFGRMGRAGVSSQVVCR